MWALLPIPPGLAPAIIAVVAFLLAWWGGIHFIRRPLGNLAEVALRWRDGDQSARVTLPGRSEIAELGRVFNAMADAKDESDRQTREGAELLSALIEFIQRLHFRHRSRRSPDACKFHVPGRVRPHTRRSGRAQADRARRSRRAAGDEHIARRKWSAARVPQAADIPVQVPNESRRRVLQTICAPIFGSSGEVRAIAGIGRDVTDAREAAETLRAARDRAEAADSCEDPLSRRGQPRSPPTAAGGDSVRRSHRSGAGSPRSMPDRLTVSGARSTT